jgi:hypothetical protein
LKSRRSCSVAPITYVERSPFCIYSPNLVSQADMNSVESGRATRSDCEDSCRGGSRQCLLVS